MKRASAKRAWLLVLGAAMGLLGSGCSLDIDPDSLVRELRVLGLRVGGPDPASTADVQATVDLSGDLKFMSDTVRLQALVVAPSGPGRRVAAPRPLIYDWYLCVGVRSLFSPGTLDPECRKFMPQDPPPRSNPALAFLDSGADVTVPSATLKAVLGQFLLNALGSGGMGMGGMGGMGSPPPTRPLTLLLPLLMQARVDGGNPNDPLDSEVAYTVSRSERKDRPDEPWRLFRYDQTHILTLVASYKLPWWGLEVGLRFRYVTGNPTTPIDGGLRNTQGQTWTSIQGERFSARLPDFHQLDLRIDKTFTFNRWKLGLYLDIQNLYNQANTETLVYGGRQLYQSAPITGIPFFPNIGVRADF